MGWLRKKDEGAPTAVQSKVTVPPTAAGSVTDEFARLANAAASGDITATNDLWKRTMQLDEWHFIGVGELPNTRPFFGSVDGKGFLMAFTSAEGAHQAAVDNQISANEAFATISMRMPAAATFAVRNSNSGAFGVLFNHLKGRQGYFAPFSNIAPMYEMHHRRPLSGVVPDFDSWVTAARSQQSAALADLVGLLFVQLERWCLINDQGSPGSAVMLDVDGQRCIVVCTDENQAERAARTLNSARPDRSYTLLKLTVDAGVPWLRDKTYQGIRHIVINPGGRAWPLTIDAVMALYDRVRDAASR